mgnify:CR=1 FL=1
MGVTEAAQSVQAIASQKAQALAALAVARVARSRADVVAPFAGVLTDVPVHLGESLPPGAPVLQIMDDTRLHVDATVDEADAAKVQRVYVDAGDGAERHVWCGAFNMSAGDVIPLATPARSGFGWMTRWPTTVRCGVWPPSYRQPCDEADCTSRLRCFLVCPTTWNAKDRAKAVCFVPPRSKIVAPLPWSAS